MWVNACMVRTTICPDHYVSARSYMPAIMPATHKQHALALDSFAGIGAHPGSQLERKVAHASSEVSKKQVSSKVLLQNVRNSRTLHAVQSRKK
jgi:hypothetical protein